MLTAIKTIILTVLLLVFVSFFTLTERKVLAIIQRRKGPNVIGAFGLLQPISDGLKLLLKETVLPSSSNQLIFSSSSGKYPNMLLMSSSNIILFYSFDLYNVIYGI